MYVDMNNDLGIGSSDGKIKDGFFWRIKKNHVN